MARRAGILIAMLLLVLAHCGVDRRSRPAHRAAAVVAEQRVTAGRLASQQRWHACALDDETALVARARCDPPPPPGARRYHRLARAAEQVRSRFQADTSAAARHALALVDFQWHGLAPAALSRAVAALEDARRASPQDPEILNDLGVAYLAMGERDQQLLPVLRALEAVEEALSVDSAHVPALFNRALILDRLYLAASARRAWAQYLAREGDAAWRSEAAARLKAGAGAVQAEPDTADPARLLSVPHGGRSAAALVRRMPDRGRALGFRVLEAWGKAVVDGDSTRAAQLLALAGAVAAAQDSVPGDRSVVQAVSFAASPAQDGARRRTLALAHAEFGAGFRLFYQGSARAMEPLASAERRFRALGAPTARWSALLLAASYVNAGRYAEGDRMYRVVLADARPDEPALRSKTLLALGLSQLRRGNYEPAIEFYQAAVPFVRQAREPEGAGHAAYLATEAFMLAGRTLDAQEEAFRGLRILSRFRRSSHLNNHLALVAEIARDAGVLRAALDVSSEVLEVAPSLGRPAVLALALCARARDLSAVGEGAAAQADLRAAAAWADSMPREPLQNRVRAAVLLARGEITGRTDPRGALPLLAAAVDSFRRFQTDRNLPEALFQAARAADAAGDRARARGWLREAVLATERQQSVFRQTAGRATFSELVERVSDQMIGYALSDGRPDSAFAHLERARMAAWPASALPPGGPLTPNRVRPRLPAGVLLVEYALLDERVVIWSVSRGGWSTHVLPVSRDSVRALVERLPDELQHGAPGAAPSSTQLYELLLRPLGAALAHARRVVVVPDRELHGVPFSALRADGRYAVEQHEFSTVPSAAFFLAALARDTRRANGGAALVIGNPALSSGAAQRLGNLPNAAREATRVASLYPGATHLAGPRADRQRVLELLPRTSLLHFAGHAVFDADRPERSYLALASGDGSDGPLLAAEIGRLRPSNLEVVVLSACSTINPRPSRAGGVAGLAYSFLHAGALATVSTLWDVSDAEAVELMVTFHQQLQHGRTPADALRTAQLRALHSASPAIRVPRTWAAFTYTGP